VIPVLHILLVVAEAAAAPELLVKAEANREVVAEKAKTRVKIRNQKLILQLVLLSLKN